MFLPLVKPLPQLAVGVLVVLERPEGWLVELSDEVDTSIVFGGQW